MEENLKQIWIRCSTSVEYYQIINVTEEEYERLKAVDGWDVEQRSDPELYNIINERIQFDDIFNSSEEFTNVFVEDV